MSLAVAKILSPVTRQAPTKFLRESKALTDLFLRRFREGVSFPSFVDRPILILPFSVPRGVPLSLLHNTALFKGGKGREGAEKRRGRGVASKGGEEEKRTRENRSVNGVLEGNRLH